MRNAHKFYFPFIFLFSCFPFFASAQTPVKTANEYVPSYTENFGYGSNMFGQVNGWVDETEAGLISKAGGTTLRPTLPDYFIETWGINVRTAAFNTYVNTLGMKNIVCFIEGPSSAHQDKTIYPGSTQPSKLFANLYTPIWNADGSVNQNNYYAYYVYKLVQAYGNYIGIWEVVNEPDFTWNADISQWLNRAPAPNEMANIQAPFFHYIRMLRITWEVVKKYNPNDYVTPGGIGYDTYLDALLRYTDNPVDGSASPQYPNKGGAYFDMVSYHTYPAYSLRYWNNSIGNFSYLRNSDYAAAEVIKQKDRLQTVLYKYGYNGTTYPKKYLIITETNISRRTIDWRTGSDEMQRNFGIKALVLAQKNDIKQLHIFGVGESMDAPPPSTVLSSDFEHRLMGLYENLTRDAPGSEKLTELGIGFRTTSQLLNGYTYDASRTAAMNLPANVEGGAFNKNGNYVYVLWAKNPNDNTEIFSAGYSFPASWNASGVERMEWNYSSTKTSVKQSPQGIVLNGAPSFFRLETAAPPATVCSASGTILREQWNNVNGGTVSSIPVTTTPASTSQLNSLEAPANIGDNYGARIRGYLCAPQSGNYIFMIAGDDDAELWLSTDDNPSNKRKIAYLTGWTYPRDWNAQSAQKSAPIALEAGKRYYIEVLHKEAWGGDNVAVGWQLPNGATEAPIGGNRLSPYVTGTTPPPPANTCSASGTILREQWNNVPGGTVSSIPVNAVPGSSSQLTSLEAPSNIGDNYAARIRGYVCAPQTGNYIFMIAGDDDAELWFSVDDNPANKKKIAFLSGWTYPRDWNAKSSQKSAAVYLEAGKRYYIEVLHKEEWGGDNVAVGWQLPSGTTEAPIGGNRLSPFVSTTSAAAIANTSGISRVISDSNISGYLKSYPNPFAANCIIEFSVDQPQQVRLDLFDIQNRLVKNIFNGFTQAGVNNKIALSASGLAQGTYIIRLTTPSKQMSRKVIISK